MSELPKEWADLDGDKRIEKLRIDDVEISILDFYSNSEYWDMRAAVALNKNTSNEILDKLKTDDVQS